MENKNDLDKKIEAIGWGSLLIWWGLRWWVLLALPDGSGLVGSGLILLGLNLARWLAGVPSRGLTTLLGLLALVSGGLMVVNETMHLPFQLPVFEILLIAIGVLILARGRLHTGRESLKPEA